MTGIFNGMSALTLFAAVRHGPITLVAPLVAIYPLVTVLLSAIMLRQVRITARIVAGTALTVARRGAGADRVKKFAGLPERHCAIGKTPLPAARLCNRRLACQNAGPAGVIP